MSNTSTVGWPFSDDDVAEWAALHYRKIFEHLDQFEKEGLRASYAESHGIKYGAQSETEPKPRRKRQPDLNSMSLRDLISHISYLTDRLEMSYFDEAPMAAIHHLVDRRGEIVESLNERDEWHRCTSPNRGDCEQIIADLNKQLDFLKLIAGPGWVKHDGRTKPEMGVYLVILASGDRTYDYVDNLAWTNEGDPADIVAYRKVGG